MTTNLYDFAYDLEKGIRSLPEFTSLQAAYAAVQADEETKQLFAEFRTMQLELQQKMMKGEQPTEEEVFKAQQAVAKVQANAAITQLMEAEQRMNIFITELNKIIMKPLEELYSAL